MITGSAVGKVKFVAPAGIWISGHENYADTLNCNIGMTIRDSLIILKISNFSVTMPGSQTKTGTSGYKKIAM
jgi:hypothetical protein